MGWSTDRDDNHGLRQQQQQQRCRCCAALRAAPAAVVWLVRTIWVMVGGVTANAGLTVPGVNVSVVMLSAQSAAACCILEHRLLSYTPRGGMRCCKLVAGYCEQLEAHAFVRCRLLTQPDYAAAQARAHSVGRICHRSTVLRALSASIGNLPGLQRRDGTANRCAQLGSRLV